MKKYLPFVASLFVLLACAEYDEDILPIVGTYDSNIINVDGPFLISVSSDYGDNVLIEAPFDGIFWSTIEADIDDEEEDRKRIDIDYQEISPGEFLYGQGVYYFNSIQLDYTIEYRGTISDYTLVGTKD